MASYPERIPRRPATPRGPVLSGHGFSHAVSDASKAASAAEVLLLNLKHPEPLQYVKTRSKVSTRIFPVPFFGGHTRSAKMKHLVRAVYPRQFAPVYSEDLRE